MGISAKTLKAATITAYQEGYQEGRKDGSSDATIEIIRLVGSMSRSSLIGSDRWRILEEVQHTLHDFQRKK